MNLRLLWLIRALVIQIFFLSFAAPREIVVATYNLWNIMYHWEVRKLYIVEMIENSDIDIIGFQEVRAHLDLQHSQLDELQNLLPSYPHKLFVPLNRINNQYTSPPGWEWEGIGFLSKHKVLTNSSIQLKRLPRNPDTNRRMILFAQFQIESTMEEINILFNHFSYDKKQQCSNVHDLLNLMSDLGWENTILLGDFNIYEDFEGIADILMDGFFHPVQQHLCFDAGFNRSQSPGNGYAFMDAWFHINPNHPGYTFSNMPNPGFINRPDRIFISKTGLKLKSVLLRGKGALYRRKYASTKWWAKLWAVQQAMKEQTEGKDYDRSCRWDCGPNGSCRCGICISGGDQNNCRLSECHECSPTKLSVLNIAILLCLPCLISITTALLVVIFGLARPRLRRLCVNRLRLGKCIDRMATSVSDTVSEKHGKI